jgi:hypothetical protein
VARRRLQCDIARQRMLIADQVRLSGLEDRQDAVGDVIAGARERCRFRRAPIVPFPLRNQVTCVGKGRHPLAIIQPSIPADVIDVQMRAQDHVDVLGRRAERSQSLEPRPAAAVKVRAGTLLVVAAAGVDQDGEAVLPNQEALDGDDQEPARRILKARHEPGAVCIEMGLRAIAKNLERRQQRTLGLDNAVQRRCAKCPVRWD